MESIRTLDPNIQDCCREIYKILLAKEKILYTELARQLTTVHNHTCLRELTRWCLKKGLPPITALVVAPIDTNDPIAKRCEQLDTIWYGKD